MEIGREEEILIKEEEILGAIHLLVIDVEEVLENALDQGAKVEVEEALVEEVLEVAGLLIIEEDKKKYFLRIKIIIFLLYLLRICILEPFQDFDPGVLMRRKDHC